MGEEEAAHRLKCFSLVFFFFFFFPSHFQPQVILAGVNLLGIDSRAETISDAFPGNSHSNQNAYVFKIQNLSYQWNNAGTCERQVRRVQFHYDIFPSRCSRHGNLRCLENVNVGKGDFFLSHLQNLIAHAQRVLPVPRSISHEERDIWPIKSLSSVYIALFENTAMKRKRAKHASRSSRNPVNVQQDFFFRVRSPRAHFLPLNEATFTTGSVLPDQQCPPPDET